MRCEVRLARLWSRLSRVSQSLWVMRSHEIRRFVGENRQKFSSLQKVPHFIVVVTRLSKVVPFESVAEIQTEINWFGESRIETVCVFIVDLQCLCYVHYLSGWKTWSTRQLLCCVSILVHLLLSLTLHLVGKLPKLSLLSKLSVENPTSNYFWKIWHPSRKNLTIQLQKLNNWVEEIKHLSCRIQNYREYRNNQGCLSSHYMRFLTDLIGVIRCSRCMCT